MPHLKIIFNPFTGKFDYVDNSQTTIPEYDVDPVSPSPEDAWVLAEVFAAPGEAMGVMGLTYSGDLESIVYKFSYRTKEGSTVRTVLS